MTLAEEVKETARAHGADLVGIADSGELTADAPDRAEALRRLLPSARRVVVTVARHSLSALTSANNEARQFDTIHAYEECARAAHRAARLLESKGFAAVAVPAFIPLDMGAPQKGMRGAIDWRRAGGLAGLGSRGENGLLVTPEFGSAIRISGLVTDAELDIDRPLAADACDHCMACVADCPPRALGGDGKIDKKKCGDHIFRYGFRYFQSFMADLAAGDPKAKAVVEGHGLRELWQNFMTGNYYYCFRCQTHCHRTPPGAAG